MQPLEEKIRNLPEQPGVYLFLSDQGAVLYVGKARNLRARVRAYLGAAVRDLPKVRTLLSKVEDLEFIVTGTEKEALLLENTLIKKHRPRYNIHLKDDKTYLHIVLDRDRPFPRFETARRPEARPGRLVFGPYASASAVRDTLRQIHKLYPLRTCAEGEFRRRKRPCLWYQMGRCSGACAGKVSREKYLEMVDQAVWILEGRSADLIRRLEEEMESASRDLRFEEAAALRDRIESVRATVEQQRVASADGTDRDVVGWFEEAGSAQIAVLSFRGGNLVDRKGFFLPDLICPPGEQVSSFLLQYYSPEGQPPPREILLPLEPGDLTAVAEVLKERRGGPCWLSVPRRGEKAGTVKLANLNAKALFEETQRRDSDRLAAVEELGRRLGLGRPPVCIECFDLSNLKGDLAVGSRVVFRDGLPDKDSYRRYRIRIPAGSDDYAMMYEVLLRRFTRGKEERDLPDLFLVDGGKGHLQVALRVLRDLGIEGVATAAIAKAHRGGRGRTGTAEDRVFLPGKVLPVQFPARSGAFLLLQRIRDEAHRFALAYHRKLRSDELERTSLDGIAGIGRARKKALLAAFGEIDGIQAASVEELAAVAGMNRRAAQAVRQHFERFRPPPPEGQAQKPDAEAGG